MPDIARAPRAHLLRHACLALTLVGTACVAAGPVVVELPEAIPLRNAGTSASDYHGGAYPGRAVWLSGNGRFAGIFQWRKDTNGDGRVSIGIGYHGNMLEDVPEPYVVDMQTGATTRYDELMTSSGDRWLVLRDEDGVWVFDADNGTRTQVLDEDALAQADKNDCSPPRSLFFDGIRERVGIIVDEPSDEATPLPGHLLVRDLDGGDEHRFDAGGDVVWRARFMSVDDVVVLYVVPLDSARADTAGGMPRRVTTCSDRLGTRFAASFSFGGWEGPPYYTLVVHRDGRRLRLDDTPTVVSDDVLALGDSVLMRMDGSRIALPSDCQRFHPIAGTGVVLLTCDEESRVMFAERGRVLPLPRRVHAVLNGGARVRDSRGDAWLPVFVDDTISGLQRLGRLRLRDARLELGPTASDDARVRDGWLLARSGNTVHVMEVATGRHYTMPITDASASLGFPWVSLWSWDVLPVVPVHLLLDPAGGRYVEVDEISAANGQGCFIQSVGEYHGDWMVGRVEQGPWRVRCTVDGGTGGPG